MSELGRLLAPYPVAHCANEDCKNDFNTCSEWEGGAYLYRDLDSDKLVVFCNDCARYAELNAGHRFKLISL